MNDAAPSPDPNGDPMDQRPREPVREQRPRTPRWVMLLGIIALVLILAAAGQFIFGIRHGPDLHSSYDWGVGLLVHRW